MSELELKNTDLSRRDFLVGTAAVAGGLALASAGLVVPSAKAFAATGDSVAVADMETGVAYTVSANMYVPYSEHGQVLVLNKNAYLTNPNNPLDGEGFPTSAMSDNGSIVSEGNGSYVVTIPIRNELFSLIELGTADGVELVSKTTTAGRYTTEDRINSVTFRIAQLTSDPVFSGNKEYAAYPIISAYKTWKIWLNVDFTTIKEA